MIRKPQYKVIKGWAEFISNVPKGEYGGYWIANEMGAKVLKYPCEIRIKVKYLEVKKK